MLEDRVVRELRRDYSRTCGAIITGALKRGPKRSKINLAECSLATSRKLLLMAVIAAARGHKDARGMIQFEAFG